MADHLDDEISYEATPPPAKPPRPTHGGLTIAIAVLVVATGAAVYFAFIRSSSSPIAVTPLRRAAAPPSTAPRPLGGTPEAIDVPPLDQTDGLVRQLVRALSTAGGVETWLAGTGLIRNFVAVTVNLQEGASPAKLLSRLRPARPFAVVERNGRESIDPRSYQRYDGITDAIVSLDPARVARVYATLKPRIEEAYRDLGFTDHPFDRALQTSLVTLVRTPIPDGAPIVARRGVRYVYVDERFEDLTAAQKQLLRVGPANVRRIDEWLRRLADALGIPAAALAAP